MSDGEKRFTVETHEGDKSLLDKFKVGEQGILNIKTLKKGDTYRVIIVRDALKKMN